MIPSAPGDSLSRRPWRSALRAAVRAYPPSFRARYGAELDELAQDVPATPRAVLDTLVHAVVAWARPAMPVDPRARRRARLEATACTTWIAWCLVAVVVPAVDRDLLDPPAPGTGPAVHRLLDAASAGWLIAAAVAVAGASLLALVVVPPAWRARTRPVLRPLGMLVLAGLVELVLTGVVVLLRRNHPDVWPNPSPAFVAAGAVWAAGLLLTAALAAVAPVLALRRAAPPADRLALAAPATLALAILVVVVLGLQTAAALQAPASGASRAALAFGWVAGVAAVVSAARGTTALRGRA